MKKNADFWAQVAIIVGSVGLTLFKSIYDTKRFDKDLNKFFDNQLEAKVLGIIKKSEGEK